FRTCNGYPIKPLGNFAMAEIVIVLFICNSCLTFTDCSGKPTCSTFSKECNMSNTAVMDAPAPQQADLEQQAQQELDRLQVEGLATQMRRGESLTRLLIWRVAQDGGITEEL